MHSSRLLKFGIFAGTSGFCLVGTAKLNDPNINLSPVGVIRFGRAALTVTKSAKIKTINLSINSDLFF